MMLWKHLFGSNGLKVIGMIHAPALPGTPKHCHGITEMVQKVRKDAEIYVNAGVDGILVENMHDIPYLRSALIGPEVTAVMSRLCREVRNSVPTSIPCGVQILAAANKESLAVALAAELQFVRCEGFVFSHVADEGWMDSCAGELLRYRKFVCADNVLVLTDIKKKHSAHAVTADVSISETAKAAEFFLSDGVVVTGSSTGQAADAEQVDQVRRACSLPVIVGSGVTEENVAQYAQAHAVIVGSFFKNSGRWDGDLDEDKVKSFMQKVVLLRKALPSNI